MEWYPWLIIIDSIHTDRERRLDIQNANKLKHCFLIYSGPVDSQTDCLDPVHEYHR